MGIVPLLLRVISSFRVLCPRSCCTATPSRKNRLACHAKQALKPTGPYSTCLNPHNLHPERPKAVNRQPYTPKSKHPDNLRPSTEKYYIRKLAIYIYVCMYTHTKTDTCSTSSLFIWSLKIGTGSCGIL